VNLGIDPPKGVLLYGPPGTGKTLCARAVANRTDATFIRVIGSELVQKYVGEGARLVRELFEMARSKKACIIFFDEVDAIGGARFDDGAGGDNEVQRTMLELINQLDGFDPRGNIKVLMATNRSVNSLSSTEYLLKETEGLIHWILHFCDLGGSTVELSSRCPTMRDELIFSASMLGGDLRPFLIGFGDSDVLHSMSVERDIRFDLIARLCPNTTGAELRSVATEVCCPFIVGYAFLDSPDNLGWYVCYPRTPESSIRTRLFGCSGKGRPTRNEVLFDVCCPLPDIWNFERPDVPSSRPLYQVYN